jgi:tetratricopeptide (TPR) repeat protein
MSHYDDEALLMYAEGASPIREEITAHVSGCAECAEMLSAHQELAALLKTAAVWDVPAAPEAAVVAKGRELAAVERRLDDEGAAAEALVDEMLTSPPRWWRTKLMREGGQTVGVVRALLGRMRSILPKAPLQALDVTTTAVELANDLPLTGYPSDLVFATRAHAWRDHAYVLSYLGRFSEALEAVDRAENLFRQTALCEYELARVDLVRANALKSLDRIDEAAALSQRASSTFLEFGDRARYINARVTAAAMLFQKQAIREALETWESVVDDPAIEDMTRVLVTNNLGMCYRELGDYDRAVNFLSRAVAEFEMLGATTERARNRWSLAATLVAAGRIPEALPIFEQTWKEFEDLGMEADGALVGLEFAEALLLVDRPERVPEICRTLLDRFTSAGMTSRAITALAFLREAVAVGQAHPTLVRHVYEYLRKLPATPSRSSGMLVARLED